MIMIRLVFAILISVGFLVGCGGGDVAGEGDSSSKSPTPTPTSTPTATPTPAPAPGTTLTSTPEQCSVSLFSKKMVSDISHNAWISTFSIVEAVVGSPIDNYEADTGFMTSAHHYWTTPQLPAGLAIDSTTGMISGTPTTTALNASTITVVDDFHNDFSNAAAQRSCTFTYNVAAPGGAQTFTPVGAMSAIRSSAVAVPLSSASNAKVLVLGGTLQSAELFDPATGTFTPTTGSMTRYGAKFATRLQDGKILIAGGYAANGTTPELRLELYDPTTQTFSLTGSSLSSVPTSVVLLPSGDVLFFEGTDTCDVSDGTTTHHQPERYNATTKAIAQAAGAPVGGMIGTLLPNGKVLIRGFQACFKNGVFGNWYNVFTPTARLYDPVLHSNAATGPSHVYNDGLTGPTPKQGLVLGDGTVLFNDYGGGLNGDNNYVQRYDPAAGTWSLEKEQYANFDFGTPILEPVSGTVLFVNLEYSRINSYNIGSSTMTEAPHYSVYNHGAAGGVAIVNKGGTLTPLLLGGATSAYGEYFNP